MEENLLDVLIVNHSYIVIPGNVRSKTQWNLI